jgi:hypothetical protein
MLDIKILNHYSKYLNIAQVCRTSNLGYNGIKTKLRRYRENPRCGSLNELEARKIQEGLKKAGIRLEY